MAGIVGHERRAGPGRPAAARGGRRRGPRPLRQAEVSRRGLTAGRAAVDRAFTRISEDKLLAVPGLQPLRRELLEDARRFYAEFIETWGDEPSLRADLADATLRLAGVTAAVGPAPEAIALYRKAIEQYERLRQGAGPPRICHAGERRRAIGPGLPAPPPARRVRRAGRVRGRPPAPGERCTRPGRPTTRRRSGPTSASPSSRSGKRTRRRGTSCAALAVARERIRREPNRADHLHVLAGRLDNLGSVRDRQRRYAEAEALFREAEDAERKAIALAPGVTSYSEWLGNHLFNRALILEYRLEPPGRRPGRPQGGGRRVGEAGRGEPVRHAVPPELRPGVRGHWPVAAVPGRRRGRRLARRGRSVLERLVRDDPSTARNHSTLGATLDALSEGRYERGEFAEAEKLLVDAVKASERAVALAPREPQCRRFLATHFTNLARVHLKKKDAVAALAAARRAEVELAPLLRGGADRLENEWRSVTIHQPGGAGPDRRRPNGRRGSRGGPHVGGGEAYRRPRPGRPAGCRRRDACVCRSRRPPARQGGRLAGAGGRVLAGAVRGPPGPPPVRRRGRGRVHRARRDRRACRGVGRRPEVVRPGPLELEVRHKQHPGESTVTEPLAKVLKWVGDVQWMRKQSAEAAAAWEAAVALYEQRLKATPDDSYLNFLLGGLLHNLGMQDYQAGRREAALARFTAALGHQAKRFAQKPDGSRRWMSHHLELRSAVLRDLGRWADAMADTTARAKLWPDRPEVLVELAREAAACVARVTDDPGSKGAADNWGAAAVGWRAHGAGQRREAE